MPPPAPAGTRAAQTRHAVLAASPPRSPRAAVPGPTGACPVPGHNVSLVFLEQTTMSLTSLQVSWGHFGERGRSRPSHMAPPHSKFLSIGVTVNAGCRHTPKPSRPDSRDTAAGRGDLERPEAGPRGLTAAPASGKAHAWRPVHRGLPRSWRSQMGFLPCSSEVRLRVPRALSSLHRPCLGDPAPS